MKFNSFTSHDVEKSSFLTDDISYNLSKKVKGKYRYNIRIEISILILLLVLYSFISYSFLQTSSGLLLLSDRNSETKYYKSIEYTDYTSEQTIIDSKIILFTTAMLTTTKKHPSAVKDSLHDEQSRPDLSVFLKSVFVTTRLSQKNTQTIIS